MSLHTVVDHCRCELRFGFIFFSLHFAVMPSSSQYCVRFFFVFHFNFFVVKYSFDPLFLWMFARMRYHVSKIKIFFFLFWKDEDNQEFTFVFTHTHTHWTYDHQETNLELLHPQTTNDRDRVYILFLMREPLEWPDNWSTFFGGQSNYEDHFYCMSNIEQW